MCGIAGYIGFEKINKERIDRAKKLLINRGPDSQNNISFSVGKTNYELIHTRLSIIDINSRSNQPFIKNNCILYLIDFLSTSLPPDKTIPLGFNFLRKLLIILLGCFIK